MNVNAFLRIALIFCCLCSMISSRAEARPQNLRVTMDDNYPPYSFKDSTGKQQGILIDQWRLWEQKSGIRVEIHAMDWGKAIAGMKRGEFDVIDTLFKTDERSEWLDFTAPYATIEVPIFFSNDIGGITDAASLKGFVVADKHGDAMISILKQQGVENVLLFDSFEAIIQAAKERKVNVFVMGKPPALYFLNKYGIADRFSQSAPLHVNQFYRAVNKGNSELLKIVDDNFAQITPGELKKIDSAWYGSALTDGSTVRHSLYAVITLALSVLALYIWSRTLRRAVNMRTAELKSSEDRYRSIIEQAADGILLGSHEGFITAANKQMEEISGRNRDELIGLHISKIFPPESIESVPLRFDLLQQGQMVTSQRNLVRPDGSMITVEMNTKMMPDGSYQSLYRDITERIRAERAFRESEDKLRAYVEHSFNVIFTLDAEGTFCFVSNAWERHFGHPASEVIGKNLALFVHPDDVALCVEYLVRILSIDESGTSPPYRVRHVDGSWRWFIANGSSYVDPVGERLYIGVAHDITEQRYADEALKESEERLRVIFETSDSGIILVNPQGIIDFANNRMAEMLDMQLHELVGTTYPEHLYESEKKTGDERMGMLIRGEIQSVSNERRYIRKDGSNFWGYLSGRRLENPDGSLRALVGFITDITDRKKADEDRLNLERQMLHSQKLESLGVLSGGIAHDFNNLLQALLGNLDLALMRLPADASGRKNIDLAVNAGKLAARLTNMMLAYSGKGLFVIKPLSLTELVEENATMLEAAISKSVSLDLNLDYTLPLVMADAGQLQQVCMNLITNASEAIGEPGGRIKLSTGVKEFKSAVLNSSCLEEKLLPGRYVWIKVCDNGCGMNEGTLQKLFDPFFTTKFTGRGLGMSAVLGIIRAHKGAFLVESRPAVGTTIQVLFPIAAPSQEKPLEVPAAIGMTTPADRHCGVILIVDDEEIIREVCVAMLDELGFETLTAATGDEALRLFREQGGRIDLVLLDQVMPGMDGVTVFKELRRIRPEIKVLLASGFSEKEVAEHFKGLRLDGFLPKPFSLDHLSAELQRALKGTEA